MTLKKFGLFFISAMISTTGIYWWQRNTPDVKGEDFAALYDVARQQAWSKLSDNEFIGAGNHLETTTVTRVDVSRELAREISSLIRDDVVLGGFGHAVALDAISSAALTNGFNLASITAAPWPLTNGINNRVDYNYAAVGPYLTNGVPAAEHLWSLGSARSDGTRPFGFNELFEAIPTNRCPLLNTYVFSDNLVSFKTFSTNSTIRQGGAIWPTNTQANFLWPFERKHDFISSPLRADKNIALDVVNVASNVYLSKTNQTVYFTLMVDTNRFEVTTYSEQFAVTNTYLVTSNAIQRYAQFNVGSRGAVSWLNHYATLSTVSEVLLPHRITSKTLVADQYAFDLNNEESATCTLSFRVPPGPGASMRLTPMSSESILLSPGTGWGSSIPSNALVHAVSFTAKNAFGYTLSQLYKCEISGGTNVYNPCVIAIGCKPASDYAYVLKSDHAAALIPTNGVASFGVSVAFSKISSAQSNEFTRAFVPDVTSNVLNAFHEVLKTNTSTLFIGRPAQITSDAIEVRETTYFTNFTYTANGAGDQSDVDRFTSLIFANPTNIISTNYLSSIGSTFSSAQQSHNYLFSSYIIATNQPYAISNTYTFAVSSLKTRSSYSAVSAYPSLWAITNGLVSRVRIYGIIDQSIGERYNPFGVATNFYGSVFVPSDKAIESSNYTVNYCDYQVSNIVSRSHFPWGHPISTSKLTLFFDEHIAPGRTNLVRFSTSMPVITSTPLAPSVNYLIPRVYFGITNAMFYDHIADRSENVSLSLRRLVVVVDWNYKYPTLP